MLLAAALLLLPVRVLTAWSAGPVDTVWRLACDSSEKTAAGVGNLTFPNPSAVVFVADRTGESGSALQMTGAWPSFSNLPNTTANVPTASMASRSISFWLKCSPVTCSTQNYVVLAIGGLLVYVDSNDGGGNCNGLVVEWYGASGFVHARSLLTGPVCDSTTWRHIALVTDGSSFSVYLQGTLARWTMPVSGNAGPTPPTVYIGWSGAASPYNYHAGLGGAALDDVRVYTRALTLSEVVQLARNVTSTVGAVALGCGPNAYALSGSAGCGYCPRGAQWTSDTTPCRPPAALGGPTDTVWWLSGSEEEGIGAYSTYQPFGLGFTSDQNGLPGGALSFAYQWPVRLGRLISPATVPGIPTAASGSSAARTVAAWIRCGRVTCRNSYMSVIDAGGFSVYIDDYPGSVACNALGLLWNGATVIAPARIAGPLCADDGSVWRHITVVYDGSIATIYVDGTARIWQPYTGAAGTATVRLSHVASASDTDDIGLYIKTLIGDLADLRIYGRALSVVEVVQIARNATAGAATSALALGCGPNGYAFTGSPGCSFCPSGATWASDSAACKPPSWRGPSDTVWWLSGTLAEGVGAYLAVPHPSLNFVADHFGVADGAFTLTNGARLSAATTGAGLPTTAGAARSAAAWIRCDVQSCSGSGRPVYILNVAGFQFYVANDGTTCNGLAVTWGSTTVRAAGPVCDGTTWRHVAAVFTGSTMLIYLDGTSRVSQGMSGTAAASATLHIGWKGTPLDSNDGFAFSGAMGDLRIFARALSAAEVTQLASNTSVSPTGTPAPTNIIPSPSLTPSTTVSVTPTLTASITGSGTPSVTRSPSVTVSPSVSSTRTASATTSPSVSGTPAPRIALASAAVQLSDPGCASVAACTSGVAALALTGTYLSSICEAVVAGGAGVLASLQSWTAAPLLSVTRCDDSGITARFDASADPAPFFWQQSNISLLAPLPGGGYLETNRIPVALPPGAPPVSSLRRCALDGTALGPSAEAQPVEWGGIVAVTAPWLARSVATGAAAAFGTSAAWAAGAGAAGAAARMPLLPATSDGSGQSTPASNNTVALQLRYVASSPCSGLTASDVAACAAARASSLTITFTVPAGRPSAGAQVTYTVPGTVAVAAVSATSVVLPQLVPRQGTLPAPADTDVRRIARVQLPQVGWSLAEMAAVGARPVCSVQAGRFASVFPCPNGTSADVPIPLGFGVRLPLTMTLAGGLLTVSLGNISYAPSGIAAVAPSSLYIPPASTTAQLEFNFSFAAVDDAALVEGACFVNSEAPTMPACCSSLRVSEVPGSTGTFSGVAAAVISCKLAPRSLRAALLPSSDVGTLSVNFSWGGLQLTAPPAIAVTAVAAPVLQSIAPPVLSPGGTAIILASLLCRGEPDGRCITSSSSDGSSAVGLTASRLSVIIGGQPCTGLTVLTDGLATCTAPQLAADTPGYPTVAATLSHVVAGPARLTLNVTYPQSSFVRAAVALPLSYLPSDASAPSPLGDVIVGVASPDGQAVHGEIECGLSPRTPNVLLVPLSGQEDIAGVRGNGSVNFGSLAVQAPFSLSSVTLTASCSVVGGDATASVVALTWRLTVRPLVQVLCGGSEALPSTSTSLQLLPTVRIALLPRHISAMAAVTRTDIARACAPGRVWESELQAQAQAQAASFQPLPPVTCTVSAPGRPRAVNGAVAPAAILQNAQVVANGSSAAAEFTSLSVGGATGVEYALTVQCSVGTVAIPPAISWTLRLTGCPRGAESADSVCNPCPTGSYSDGGVEKCRTCPATGVACSSGILIGLPGFYRPPSQHALPLDAAAELHPCPFPERCLVNDTLAAAVSTSTSSSSSSVPATESLAMGAVRLALGSSDRDELTRGWRARALQAPGNVSSSATNSSSSPQPLRTWSCSAGTAGILCARCAEGYALVGNSCMPCLAAPVNMAAVAGVGLLYVAAVAFVALRKRDPTGRTEDAIALRLLLSHFQMASSIRAFKISGSALFKEAMAFTNVVGTAMLSDGPVHCALDLSFQAVFYGTLLAPLITAALALTILLAATALGRGPAASAPQANATASRTSSSSSIGDRIRAALAQRQHHAILLFVLQISYMPIVGSCLSVLDCTPPVDGVRYVSSDTRVECRGSSYTLMTAAAVLGLLVVGGGFPLIIMLRFRRISVAKFYQPHFQAAWGFLTRGYRFPPADGAATTRPVTLSTADSQSSIINPLAASPSPSPSPSPSIESDSGSANPLATASRTASRAQASDKVRLCPNCMPACLRRWYTCARDRPSNMAWAEAIVLCRKLLVVLLARLVVNPLAQIACFETAMVGFLVVHIALRPFDAWRHQFAEGLSLVCIALTAALAILVQPAAGLAGGAAVAVTVAMLLLNLVTVAFLGLQYVQLCCGRHKGTVVNVAAAAKRRLSRTRVPANAGQAGGRTVAELPPALKFAAAHKTAKASSLTTAVAAAAADRADSSSMIKSKAAKGVRQASAPGTGSSVTSTFTSTAEDEGLDAGESAHFSSQSGWDSLGAPTGQLQLELTTHPHDVAASAHVHSDTSASGSPRAAAAPEGRQRQAPHHLKVQLSARMVAETDPSTGSSNAR